MFIVFVALEMEKSFLQVFYFKYKFQTKVMGKEFPFTVLWIDVDLKAVNCLWIEEHQLPSHLTAVKAFASSISYLSIQNAEQSILQQFLLIQKGEHKKTVPLIIHVHI